MFSQLVDIIDKLRIISLFGVLNIQVKTIPY